MKLYQLSCPQCGWQAQRKVDEATALRFLNELEYCRECARHGRPRCKYVAREIITVGRKG